MMADTKGEPCDVQKEVAELKEKLGACEAEVSRLRRDFESYKTSKGW